METSIGRPTIPRYASMLPHLPLLLRKFFPPTVNKLGPLHPVPSLPHPTPPIDCRCTQPFD